MTASRRTVLGGVAAVAFAGPALALDRLVDPKKVFPYLDAYLRIPPAKRSQFTVAYRLVKDRPTGLWLVEGQQRTPIPLAADGKMLRLPTAGQLEHAQLLISGPDKAKYGVNLNIEPLATPAQEMDAATLHAAVTQGAEGMKGAAGAIGFMVPRLKGVMFMGVASGEAVFADGRRTPLPMQKDAPFYEPAKLPGVKTLRFPKAPTRMELG